MENEIISLGYNCFIKKYLDFKSIRCPTNLFDYVGVPLWAINELFKNDFKDFTNEQFFEMKDIISKEEPIMTNTKYYMRFMHDFGKSITFTSFKEKYERRIVRLKERLLINSTKNKQILFLRLEENSSNRKGRINYPEYAEKYEKDEVYYSNQFCDIITALYPQLDFRLIVISDKFTKKINSKLLFLKSECISNWGKCANLIDEVMLANNTLIDDLVKKIEF